MLRPLLLIIITLITIQTAFALQTGCQCIDGRTLQCDPIFNSTDTGIFGINLDHDTQDLMDRNSTINTINRTHDINMDDIDIDYSTTTIMLFHILAIIMAFIVAGFAESKKSGFGVWAFTLWFIMIAAFIVSENTTIAGIYFVIGLIPLIVMGIKRWWKPTTS